MPLHTHATGPVEGLGTRFVKKGCHTSCQVVRDLPEMICSILDEILAKRKVLVKCGDKILYIVLRVSMLGLARRLLGRGQAARCGSQLPAASGLTRLLAERPLRTSTSMPLPSSCCDQHSGHFQRSRDRAAQFDKASRNKQGHLPMTTAPHGQN